MAACGLDFPHAPLWCPACYAEAQTNAIIAETRRANDLTQEELAILRENRADMLWSSQPSEIRWANVREPRPSRPVYLPPPPPPPAKAPAPRGGGIQVEPRDRPAE
jgi:hypothetical protein